MSVPEETMIGLGLFAAVMTFLIVLEAIVTRLRGPDPDLERPWFPEDRR